MKRAIFGILILALISGLLYYWLTQDKGEEEAFIRISGNIEATEVNVGFKISGRIVNLFVQEGDEVTKGKVLAKLDDEDLLQRVELAKAALRSNQARLEKLLAGSRPEELREAEAALRQAQHDFENKQIQYERMKSLYEKRVISKESQDNTETAYKVAKASVERAKENYLLVQEGPRKEDIEDARAQVEQARASLKFAETQLAYSVLYSPMSGVIHIKSAEIGEVVNPGTSVLTLVDIKNIWLKSYVPEPDLSRIKWGQEVIVTTDVRPRKEYRGRISFISSQAEFTPKQIQTEKERVTLVYRIKVDIANPERELKPGMPADGRILLRSSPTAVGASNAEK